MTGRASPACSNKTSLGLFHNHKASLQLEPEAARPPEQIRGRHGTHVLPHTEASHGGISACLLQHTWICHTYVRYHTGHWRSTHKRATNGWHTGSVCADTDALIRQRSNASLVSSTWQQNGCLQLLPSRLPNPPTHACYSRNHARSIHPFSRTNCIWQHRSENCCYFALGRVYVARSCWTTCWLKCQNCF